MSHDIERLLGDLSDRLDHFIDWTPEELRLLRALHHRVSELLDVDADVSRKRLSQSIDVMSRRSPEYADEESPPPSLSSSPMRRLYSSSQFSSLRSMKSGSDIIPRGRKLLHSSSAETSSENSPTVSPRSAPGSFNLSDQLKEAFAKEVLESEGVTMIEPLVLCASVFISEWESYATTFIGVFMASGRSMDLVQFCVKQEVMGTKRPELLFREESLYILIMRTYSLNIAHDYIKNVVKPIHLKNKKHQSNAAILGKLETEEPPRMLRWLFKLMVLTIKQRFPDTSKPETFVVAFFFLRCVSPLITSPLPKWVPAKKCLDAKQAMVICRNLQVAVNDWATESRVERLQFFAAAQSAVPSEEFQIIDTISQGMFGDISDDADSVMLSLLPFSRSEFLEQADKFKDTIRQMVDSEDSPKDILVRAYESRARHVIYTPALQYPETRALQPMLRKSPAQQAVAKQRSSAVSFGWVSEDNLNLSSSLGGFDPSKVKLRRAHSVPRQVASVGADQPPSWSKVQLKPVTPTVARRPKAHTGGPAPLKQRAGPNKAKGKAKGKRPNGKATGKGKFVKRQRALSNTTVPPKIHTPLPAAPPLLSARSLPPPPVSRLRSSKTEDEALVT